MLANHFLEVYADQVGRHGMHFSPAAMAALTGYEWPGNIRELGNVVQRAMILATGRGIEPENLMLPQAVSARPEVEAGGRSIRDLERDTILTTLSRCGGSRKKTAEALGMSERTLRYKLQRYRENGELDGDGLL